MKIKNRSVLLIGLQPIQKEYLSGGNKNKSIRKTRAS